MDDATLAALRAALEASPRNHPLRMAWARALAEVGRREEALAAYREAVAGDAALEDPELATRLSARVVEVAHEGGRPTVKLAVLSNDDTDESELRRLLAPAQEKVSFADVGGLDAVKEQIRRRIVLPFQAARRRAGRPARVARLRRLHLDRPIPLQAEAGEGAGRGAAAGRVLTEGQLLRRRREQVGQGAGVAASSSPFSSRSIPWSRAVTTRS